ncbi:MAG: hypothetical protein U9Q03_01735 [Patescibacteria group bacterium]|nr:hypothetical protein [Patescibacteria group bacterium]
MIPQTDRPTVLVFGSPDFEPDALPLKILPRLKERLPEIDFVAVDPNEEWDIAGDITVIDTAINLTEPRIFDSLDAFEAAPRVSMHDFDALANLRLMQKLGKIDSVRVITLPPDTPPDDALNFIDSALGESLMALETDWLEGLKGR